MSLYIFAERHECVLALPGPCAPALPSDPLQTLAPLLLALQVVGEGGEWVEEVQGPTMHLLCRSYWRHTVVVVGRREEPLRPLLTSLLSWCRRLCGPGLQGVAGRAAALRCLVDSWRRRLAHPASSSGSLQMAATSGAASEAVGRRAAAWVAARRRRGLKVQLLVADGEGRVVHTSPSLPTDTAAFLQQYLVARLGDPEVGEDGALREHHGLPAEAMEVMHLRLTDFPYSPVVVLAARAGAGVAVALVELGDAAARRLVGLVRLCLWPGAAASSLRCIQEELAAGVKWIKVKELSAELRRLHGDLVKT